MEKHAGAGVGPGGSHVKIIAVATFVILGIY